MEFPETGKQCSVEDCKQLDFLPFVCEHCQITFCKHHYNPIEHKCSKWNDNVASTKAKLSSYVCSSESCSETSPIEMQCVKCKKHFCLQHRYHGCLEITDDERAAKLKKWQIPKRQFAEAKAIVDQEISNTLQKSKNTAMANKVRLMRVKGSAVGPKNVPTNERCYFLVYVPKSFPNKHIGPSRGIYVNINWSIGKAIDAITNVLKISTNNNTSNKLQLFHHSNGNVICTQMDTPLAKLFETSELIDGQSVILEYSSDASVDVSLYK